MLVLILGLYTYIIVYNIILITTNNRNDIYSSIIYILVLNLIIVIVLILEVYTYIVLYNNIYKSN